MAEYSLYMEGSLGNTVRAVLRTPLPAAAMLSTLTDVAQDRNAGDF